MELFLILFKKKINHLFKIFLFLTKSKINKIVVKNSKELTPEELLEKETIIFFNKKDDYVEDEENENEAKKTKIVFVFCFHLI